MQWALVRTAFEELLELSTEQRAARLADLQGRTPEIAAEVAALLSADAASGTQQLIDQAGPLSQELVDCLDVYLILLFAQGRGSEAVASTLPSYSALASAAQLPTARHAHILGSHGVSWGGSALARDRGQGRSHRVVRPRNPSGWRRCRRADCAR